MDTDQLVRILIPVVAVLVVLLGIGIAVVRMMLGRRKRQAVEDWGRAAYSLWTGGEDCAAWTADRAQDALKNVQKNLPLLRQQIWPTLRWDTPLVVSDD